MKTLLSTFILLQTVVCMYFITDYANKLQISLMGIEGEILSSYHLIWRLSNIFSSLIPIIVFAFLYITIEISMNTILDENISRRDLYNILGIAFTPMLCHEYFYYLNLVTFCNTSKIKSVEDLINMHYFFNLTPQNLNIQNTFCWSSIYLIVIMYFFFKGKSLFKTFFPSYFHLP